MPTYEYRCDACDCGFEVEKRMSDPVAEACPACGSDRTHRLISQSSFVLKGSGWYVTDYARKDKGAGGSGTHGKPAPAKPAETTAPAPAPAAEAPAASPAPAAPPAAAPASTAVH